MKDLATLVASDRKCESRNTFGTDVPEFFSHQVTKARRFYLGLSPNLQNAFPVVCGGMEHCEANYRVERANFPFFSVEFVFRGHGHFKAGGKTHCLSPGSVFTYAPGVEHEIVGDRRNPLVKYFVDFGGDKAEELFRTSKLGIGAVARTTAPEHLRRILEDLIDAGFHRSPYQGSICAVIAQHLLFRVAETSTSLGSSSSKMLETYEACRRCIEDHYGTIESLSDLATRCKIDPSYLCRIFQRFEGQSPWKLVIQLRMHEAAERLQVPGTLVKHVAAELGFGDVFQFSRTFRRVFGIAPRQFLSAQRSIKSTEEDPNSRTNNQ